MAVAKSDKKRVVAPKEGDLVDVHSGLLNVHGLHAVQEVTKEGILIQAPGSHHVARIALEDIEAVYRRVS